MTKKKLLMVSTATVYGGAEVYHLRLSLALGDKFQIIHAVSNKRLHKKLEAQGQKAFFFSLKFKLSYVVMLSRLVGIIVRNGIALVHLNDSRETYFAPILFLFARLWVTKHTGATGKGVRQKLKSACMSAVLSFCRKVVCVTPYIAQQLSRNYVLKKKIVVIPNWVPDNFLSSGPVTITQRNPLNITIVSRLEVNKGHLVLFDAIKDMTGVVLNVVGEGRDGDILRAHAKTLPVTFRGYQSDILSVYRQSDILVLPSFSEGSPLALLEAMALGIPVVGSDIRGIKQIISNNHNGMLFPAGDSCYLRKVLVELQNDMGLRKELGRNARETIRQRYSSGICLKQYDAVLRSL